LRKSQVAYQQRRQGCSDRKKSHFTLRFMPNESDWDLSGFSTWHLLL
jgi:hypothetical protein